MCSETNLIYKRLTIFYLDKVQGSSDAAFPWHRSKAASDSQNCIIQYAAQNCAKSLKKDA